MPMQGLGPFLEQAYRRWKGFISPEEARAIEAPAGTVLTLPLQDVPHVPAWYAERGSWPAQPGRPVERTVTFNQLLYNYQEIALSRELADVEIVIDHLHMTMASTAFETFLTMRNMWIDFADFLTGSGSFRYIEVVPTWWAGETATQPPFILDQQEYQWSEFGGNLMHLREAQQLKFGFDTAAAPRQGTGATYYFSIHYRVKPLVDPLLSKRRNYAS